MKHLDQPFDVIIQKRLGPDLMWVTVVAESPLGRACDSTSSAAAVEGSQLARGVAGENLTTGRRPIKKRFGFEPRCAKLHVPRLRGPVLRLAIRRPNTIQTIGRMQDTRATRRAAIYDPYAMTCERPQIVIFGPLCIASRKLQVLIGAKSTLREQPRGPIPD